MDSKQATMIFRVELDLKTDFETMAKDLDLNASQLLRQMMRGAVAQHKKQTAQQTLRLEEPKHNLPATPPATATKKPKKGQKMAASKPANWRPKCSF